MLTRAVLIDDVIVSKARHPWRLHSTNDARAQVAFVPVLVDHVARNMPTQWNVGPTDSDGILKQMADVVRRSPLYPRVRHVLIANDWMSQNYFAEIHALFPEGNVVVARMENLMTEYRHTRIVHGKVVHQSGLRQPYSCSFGLGYTSSYTAYQPADFKRERIKKTALDEILSKGSTLDGLVHPFVPRPATHGRDRTISISFSGAVGYAMHGLEKKLVTGYKHRVRLFEFGRCKACSKRDGLRGKDGGAASCGTCGDELPNVFMVAMESGAMVARYAKTWWGVDAIPACPQQQNTDGAATPPGGSGSSSLDSLRGYNRCTGPVPLVVAQRARELANFSLALRGDTLGSDRWINAMVAGAIPVHVGTVRRGTPPFLPRTCTRTLMGCFAAPYILILCWCFFSIFLFLFFSFLASPPCVSPPPLPL